MTLSGAERNRRYRARKRGEPVPRGKPGRPRFRPESPEEIVGALLNADPQRLRDFEAAVKSRGMSLSQYVERQRRLLDYGEPQSAAAPSPRDPLTQALLDFGRSTAADASADPTAVTRGGPTLDFVQRSGVASPYAIEPCIYCSKPASCRTADDRPAHAACERRALRRAAGA